MIFNELYSAYYNAVAKIIKEAVNGNLNEKNIKEIAVEKSFGESMLTIIPALKDEKWQVIRSGYTTPLQHEPTMPLTNIQEMWLKAISLDPRIKLFDIDFSGLDNIEPLFTDEDYYVFDSYNDGDPYTDELYIHHFKTIIKAIKSGQTLKVEIINRNNKIVTMNVFPIRIEYSEKDDKFRLITSNYRYATTINIARIKSCVPYSGVKMNTLPTRNKDYANITFELTDERNALERALLHFAHFEKKAEKITQNKYLVTLSYDRDDETELVIRILSFGPFLKVLEPQSFVDLIKERLIKQKSCELK